VQHTADGHADAEGDALGATAVAVGVHGGGDQPPEGEAEQPDGDGTDQPGAAGQA